MSFAKPTRSALPTSTGDEPPSITNMMLLRDKSKLNLFQTDAIAFQQSHARAGLPTYFQKALTSDPEKLGAFLPTFFAPTDVSSHYTYKIFYADRELSLVVETQKKPESADDFYVLAIAINHHYKNITIVDQNGAAIDEHTSKAFIYSLLHDAALTGHAAAKKTLTKIEEDAKAHNYIALSRFDFLYSYKTTNIFLLTPMIVPANAEQFHELANILQNQPKPCFEQGMILTYHNHHVAAADRAHRDDLIYGVLGDAAKAGHAQANEQLIAATIAGNRKARQYVTFKEYNNLPVKLPRPFVTAADYRALGTSLIVHGKNILDSARLEGPFYIVENGSVAERLGYALLVEAKKLARAEEEARLTKAYRPEQPQAKPDVVAEIDAGAADNWIKTYHSFFKSPDEHKGKGLLDIAFEEECVTDDQAGKTELSSPRL